MCPGQALTVPEGVSPYCAYPSGVHKDHTYPWTVYFSDTALVIRSTRCTEKRGKDNGPCGFCLDLLNHSVIEGIQHRNLHGVLPNTPYIWLTMHETATLLRRKNAQINRLKLAGLNMAKALFVRARHIDAYKRFVVAVGEGKIPRLHTLVSVSRKAGDSIYAILEKCNRAVREVYRPMSYQEQDFQQLFLFHKLGGVAVAELAHRVFGLPSIETTRRHIATEPLVASPKMPTLTEMKKNLDHAFPPVDASIMSAHRVTGGFQLMADEIKLETRMRWDPRTNMILGVCREHGKTFGLEFRSMAQAVALRDVIKDEKVHLASEVILKHLIYCQVTYCTSVIRQLFSL